MRLNWGLEQSNMTSIIRKFGSKFFFFAIFILAILATPVAFTNSKSRLCIFLIKTFIFNCFLLFINILKLILLP